MWNKPFENLRMQMTCVYAAIFGVLILAIVAAAYTLIWWEILANEKTNLIAQIYHEGEEWIESEEPPCSQAAMSSGKMFAYFVAPDGKTVILNQLGDGDVGKALLSHQSDWPQNMEGTHLIRMRGANGERYRYLAGVAPVVDKGKQIGTLYMFKNMEFYYYAAFKTLFLLLCLAVVLYLAACYFGYWLAGRNILPISQMYERQKQFTADASHEMRTPLAVMKLAVQGLREDEDSRLSEFAKESVEMLDSEADRLSRLTENLMTLARSDEDNLPAYTEQVDMTALCHKVAAQLALLAEQKQIVLKQEIQADLSVYGDELALSRLLIILIDNALKYSSAKTTVTLRGARVKAQMVIEVRDEGCGISDEDKQRIFDRFFRVDKARSRSQGGLGLGLSLAWAIVQQHGGSIKVLDNKPKGTIMYVQLPLGAK
ncbi:cell wall metabolism sensor histidine kinase WalK [uncultured Phascolarctobacterium sp.]|jgi:two-component system sensor histidine kinase CiaH|uniref:sensor histidine kinase n=1 Tax=uncultured Phascolarctobacterium sp. TaxID=512296 RepID=UPI0025EA3B09|nr:HAMP domain-containing sensor histidine kinase [uncultured Phascolarctobacterium sp.]